MTTLARYGSVGMVAGLVALAGCAPAVAPEPDYPRPTPSPASAQELSRALNEAGFRVFLGADDGENLAVSPASIGLAFGMVDAGASGVVDDALQELFAYPTSGTALLDAFNSLELGVESEPGSGAQNAEGDTVDLPRVRVANRVFVDDDFEPIPDYVERIGTYFGAGIQPEPLRAKPAQSREVIDAWVSDRTEGLIPRIMPDDLPNDATQMILINTVYLKAQWFHPFSAESTYDDTFHELDGSTSTAPLMGNSFNADFVVGDDFDAGVLPYVGDLEMVLVVPHEGKFDAVQSRLSMDFMDELDASWTQGSIAVRMPKFESESKVNLREVIEQALGIDTLFDEVGLDGIGPDLYLDSAVHATKVIVDEKGTEAAAATVVGVAGAAAPMFDAELIADKPFLYIIRDKNTGAILFVGQYVSAA